MERWIVSRWDCHNPSQSVVVFEGSREHCVHHARELLMQLPTDMDCMAMSEKDWKWCQQFSGGVSDE